MENAKILKKKDNIEAKRWKLFSHLFFSLFSCFLSNSFCFNELPPLSLIQPFLCSAILFYFFIFTFSYFHFFFLFFFFFLISAFFLNYAPLEEIASEKVQWINRKEKKKICNLHFYLYPNYTTLCCILEFGLISRFSPLSLSLSICFFNFSSLQISSFLVRYHYLLHLPLFY